MAQPTVAIATKSKDHRRRKNPRSAEIFAAERKARNAKRPKQRWIPSSVASSMLSNDDTLTDQETLVVTLGHWTREAE